MWRTGRGHTTPTTLAILDWTSGSGYRKETLRLDGVACLTTAAVVIPRAMGEAWVNGVGKLTGPTSPPINTVDAHRGLDSKPVV